MSKSLGSTMVLLFYIFHGFSESNNELGREGEDNEEPSFTLQVKYMPINASSLDFLQVFFVYE